MSNTPWEEASLQYAGWIPNALGHLSFSLIGQGTSPKAHAAARSAGAHGQHVIAHHTRVVGDYALPNRVMRWFRLGSVHDWLLVASTAPANYPSSRTAPATTVFIDDRGMLLGKIFLFAQLDRPSSLRRQRWGTWRLRRRFRRYVRRITKETIRNSHSSLPPNKFNRKALALVRHFKSKGAPIAGIDFALLRTGEARFWLTEDIKFRSTEARDTVIKSAYLFLKDVTHRHVHHHHSQDSMLPIVQVSEASEIEWQRETIWALSRTIEDNIRRCRRKSLRAALGIIPFAENFHALYSSMMRSPSGENGFVSINNLDHYSYEALRKSVTVQLETRSWWLAGMTAAVASIFAITMSAIIAIENISPNNSAAWPAVIAESVSQQPVLTVFIVWVALWITYESIYREAMVDTSPFTLVRFVRRLTLATTVSLYRWIGLPRLASPVIELLVQGTFFAAALWWAARLFATL